MKRINFFIVLLISLLSLTVSAQNENNVPLLKKPSEGKVLIYFVRPGALAFLIDFKVFHQDKYLGKISSNNYLTYECEPGEQLFWAASENRDFVLANLEANKTYVVAISAQMGAFSAQVNVKPLSPKNEKDIKSLNFILGKNKGRDFTEESVQFEDQYESAQAGLKKYEKLKESGSDKILKLTADMNF